MHISSPLKEAAGPAEVYRLDVSERNCKMNVKHRRIAFAVSAIISITLFWLYHGLYPFGTGYGVFPPTEGTMLNAVMRVVALPLMLLLFVGGGIAAAAALSDQPADEKRRTALAIVTPLGIPWVFELVPFMANKMTAEVIFFSVIVGVALLILIVRKTCQHGVLTR